MPRSASSPQNSALWVPLTCGSSSASPSRLSSSPVIALGQGLPRPPPLFWPWVVVGAVAQVGATLLMLVAMTDRSFVVVYAYIKTEPVQVALFGLVFLGDAVTPVMAAAIVTATAGVVIMAIKRDTPSSLTATLLGLAAGAMFALSAVGFRGAILRLDGSATSAAK